MSGDLAERPVGHENTEEEGSVSPEAIVRSVFQATSALRPEDDRALLNEDFIARVAAELPGHLSPEQQFVMRFPNQRKISSMSGAALAAAISAAAEQAAEESRKLGRDPAVN